MFDFDIRNTVKRLLPPDLRKPKMIAWLVALLVYVEILKSYFLALQRKHRYDLAFSSQTLSLTQRLNNQFDSSLDRIYITTNATFSDGVFVPYVNENQTSPYIGYIGETFTPVYIDYISAPITAANADFVVHVPTGIILDENEMRAVINMYKIASKTYAIEYF